MSETEVLIRGIYISGKQCQIEADKSRNDSKTLQNHTKRVEQQSRGRKTHARRLQLIFKNRASLLRLEFFLASY